MGQRWDYFHYREGESPDLLRVGNMVLDFKNPRTLKPFRHPDWSEEERQKWMTADKRPSVQIAFSNSSGWEIGGGVQNLAHLASNITEEGCTVIVGKDGSKEEIIEPEEYFSTVLLANSNAKLWLASRLSVARRLQFLRKKFSRIEIWLLTGRYLIDNASVWSVTQSSKSASGQALIPLPDTTGISELLKLNPKVHFAVGSGVFQQVGTSFEGKRVWAARYQKVAAAYTLVRPGDAFPASSVQLLNVFSAQRGGDKEVATLKVLQSTDGPANQEPVGPEEDNDWDAFNEELAQIEKLLDDD